MSIEEFSLMCHLETPFYKWIRTVPVKSSEMKKENFRNFLDLSIIEIHYNLS